MARLRKGCRLVVFGFGNPGRGDDALGLALLERLARQPETQNPRGCYRRIEAIQLQIEHALDLVDQDLALFLDASMVGRGPYQFQRLRAARETTYTSHTMSPGALLQVYETIEDRAAPPAYQLTILGERFDLDAPLSETAERHLDAAYQFLAPLYAAPDVSQWERHLDEDAA